MLIDELFRNPTAEYRAKPFWAWNDELNADEIKRQILCFAEMGFGGFFMHSRVGLKTAFLGEKWFEMIGTGIAEAKALGMEAWIYDEDRFPSGLLGGLVTLDDRYRQRRLHCMRIRGENIPIDNFASFTVSFNKDNELLKYKKKEDDEIADNEEALVFSPRIAQSPQDSYGIYNGQYYLDTLNKEAVRAFIEMGYEPYKRFASEFSKTLKGVFTDEPNRSYFLSNSLSGIWAKIGDAFQIPWTNSLPDEFKNRMGYDLTEHLPEIFYNMAGYDRSKVRADVFECISQLYTEAYAKQIGQWCEANNLILTGHIFCENSLNSQINTSGSPARFYEHMQVPGMDAINRFQGYIVPKQLQSAARQCGRKWKLSEMYAGQGWNGSFERYKTYGDWQTVLGVNFRCPHLSLYSMSGLRKRDYPPTISPHQHWYREYKVVEDYFARAAVFINQGDPLVNMCIIHPLESVTGTVKPTRIYKSKTIGYVSDNPWIGEYDRKFRQITEILLGLQLDFDYVDEEMLGRLGSVGVNGLTVGRMTYRRVLVPPVPNLRGTTIKFLSQFSKLGFEVLYTEIPKSIDWQKADVKGRVIGIDEITVHYAAERVVSVEGGNDKIFAHYSDNTEGFYLMLANIDTKNFIETKVNVKAQGQVQEWDCTSGEKWLLDSTAENSFMSFNLSFEPGQTHFIGIAAKNDLLLTYRRKYREIIKIMPASVIFKVLLDSPNVIAFDRANFKIANGEWNNSCQILEIDNIARDTLGIERRSNRIYQPWFREKFFKTGTNRKVALQLQYFFIAEYLPHELELAMEQPKKYEIKINGNIIEKKITGSWTDSCIKKMTVPVEYFKTGLNLIEMAVDFQENLDLENIFLLGNFGVRLENFNIVMTKPVVELKSGDITKQGLPFYAGNIRYEIRFEPNNGAYLVVPSWEGICLRIDDTLVPWRPYEAQILPSNIHIVELIGHRANANGLISTDEGFVLKPQGLYSLPYVSLRV